MASTTAAGTAIAISPDAPATQTQAGYAALTFTEISGVEQIGVIGATTNKVEFQPLKGPKEKHKGSTDYGSLQPSMAHNDADTGQSILRAASDPSNHALYSFRVTYPTGEQRYFRGRVFGYPENVGNADSVLTANPTIEISTIVVKESGGGVPATALTLDGTAATALSLDGISSTILVLEA